MTSPETYTISTTTHGTLTTTTLHLPTYPPTVVSPIILDHNLLIHLNPLVIVSTSLSPLTPDSPRYAITERKTLLGCLPLTWTYTATFRNLKSGVWVDVEAPMGVKTNSVWVVEAEGEGMTVTETFEIVEAPWWARGYVRTTAAKAHRVLIERFAAAVAKRADRGQDGGGDNAKSTVVETSAGK